MRLDHLLSKEHRDAERRHGPASIERIEGEAQGWNIDIDESLEIFTSVLPACRRGKSADGRRSRHNTLLGPEGTGNPFLRDFISSNHRVDLRVYSAGEGQMKSPPEP